MSRRICKVEKPFTAWMVESQGKRLFRPDDALVWDGNESDPVEFECDNTAFRADLKQFLASVRVPA